MVATWRSTNLVTCRSPSSEEVGLSSLTLQYGVNTVNALESDRLRTKMGSMFFMHYESFVASGLSPATIMNSDLGESDGKFLQVFGHGF